jgi:hypothetical protein
MEQSSDDLDGDLEPTSDDVLDEDYLTRDDFNLHKMIVAITSPGKVRCNFYLFIVFRC